MIRIPTIQSTGLGAPAVSSEAAAAPARALGAIAGAVGDTSGHLVKLGQDLARVDNARMESEAHEKLAAAYAAFQSDLQKETDPKARIDKTNAFLAQQQGALIPSNAPPVVRGKLGNYFGEFATRAKISAAEDAAKLNIRRTTLALGNRIDRSYETLDQKDHSLALDIAQEAGILLPEQRQAEEERFAKALQDRRTTEGILEDPGYWLENNPAPAEGQPPAEWARYKDVAVRAFREETAETDAQIHDAIALGNITTPEEIDELAANLRPAAREKLKGVLAQRADAEHKKKLLDPEYQDELVGKAASILKSYNPEGEDFDTAYIEINSLIRQIPESDIRDDLESRLKAKLKGEKKRITTHAEEARAALDEHYDALAKKLPEAKSTFSATRAVNDGLLRDPAKLTALGFNEEQVEEIIGKEDDTDSTRSTRFRQLAIHRDGAKTAGTFTTAAAEAILNGKSEFTILDPEAEGKRILAGRELAKSRGKSLRVLSEWLATTGRDATEEQINSKIQELAGKDAREKLQSGFFEEKNEAEAIPKGADPSTSSLPLGNDISTVVKQFEAGGAKDGFHRTAYWDHGQFSIGYGTKSKEGEVIDKAEAERRLAAELSSHRSRVEAEAKRVGMTFQPHEIDALTSFDYNTGGIRKLLAGGTRSKAEIASKMLLYVKADGTKLAGLEKRRAAERHIFLNGYKTPSGTNPADISSN